MTDEFKTYESALNWLFYELPNSAPEQIHKASKGLEESALLLEMIGNPQNDYPTIHVAGTSGKGSTVTLISDILGANGVRVGSILSPHVYDFRERFLINGQFADKKEVLNATNQLRPILTKLNSKGVFPSYFQMVFALAYLVFSKHQLDYLVIETGLGGLYDTTNLIARDDKIVILNSIGLDHTEILGNTIEEIAIQKAGIISKGSIVFALAQEKAVNRVFAEQAEIRGADKLIKLDVSRQEVKYSDSMRRNLTLASHACKYLAKRDNWSLEETSIEKAADNFSLPGRFEKRIVNGKIVILDGAHNSQKTKMLLDNLSISFPGQKFNVLFASQVKRSPDEILKLLAPVTAKLYLTSYSVFKDTEHRGAIDFTNYPNVPEDAQVISEIGEAVKIINRSKENWLITGSFFLVSDVGKALG